MPWTILRLFVVSLAFISLSAIGPANARQVKLLDKSSEAIFNDPNVPIGGNPNGDVTIVAFEDYNCPYCKKSEPALQKLIKDDGHIRLVYKDWPILSNTSVYAAIVALGAKYQSKYEVLHRAFMRIRGHADNAMIDHAVHESNVDVARLNKDLAAHSTEIHAIIGRNNAQALVMGFKGTPVFLIGPYFVAGALDYNQFKNFVAQARSGAVK